MPAALLLSATWAPAGPISRQAIKRAVADRDLAQIRVRVREALPRVAVRGMDLQLRDAVGVDRDYAQVSEWQLFCRDGRVRAKSAKHGEIDLAAPVSLKARGGFISVRDEQEEAQFNGEIRVVTSGFLCEVVNVLPTEKYLEGVVNAEFSSKWSAEAVAAQVVAARSYAAYQIRGARQAGAEWDLDSTTADQVYHGTAREDAQAARIVRRSEGLTLVTVDGKKQAPLKAYYHSTCGGMTDLPQNVWGSKTAGFQKRVPCPYCKISPRYRWTNDLEREDVQARLRRGLLRDGRFPASELAAAARAQLASLQVTAKDAFGRVTEVTTIWSVPGMVARTLRFTGARMRDWLGSLGSTNSSRFDVTETPTGFRLSGRGFGHGVGLCQWGAKGMGDQGFSMKAILKHYYPNAKLAKLW